MTTETTIQSRRERRMASEAAARRSAKARAAKTGRNVGVVLGTSGLLLSTTVAAMADETSQEEGRAQATVAIDASGLEPASVTEPAAVTASEEIELAFDRPAVSTEAAPEPTTSTSSSQSDTSQSSSTQSGTTQAAASTQTQSAPANGGVINTAYSAIGVPYVWAGSSLSGMDCSGFINWVYRQHGINLPRSTHGMLAALPRVSTPQPGDIVISTGIRSAYHAGIYVGNGQMVGSLSGQGVTTHGYHEGWHNVVAILRPGG
ncbi:C40 family peptidase [Nesterenkonia ebinurensis]|uniref:C40 family peptidase n=1 Tax=Nesterenkonia ebinurensis TaxID=2608252 RepID=UPI00168BE12C|nr:C40 family peptidase [Nesterenkonia ebinurensis]